MSKLLFLLILTGCAIRISAQKIISTPADTLPGGEQPACNLLYAKPASFGFLKNVPADLLNIARSPFRRVNVPAALAVAGSTLLLIPVDQQVLDGVKNLSAHMGLNPETAYHDIWRPGGTRVLKVPQNLNTALYQMGEGGTSMLVAAGFFVYGKIGHNYRSLQTASDLVETYLTMGLTTQLIKRISGRQSPFMSTHPGGDWHPFPSFSAYQRNTSNFDAFPSGHLATMMATVTVIATNYPEKKWILPLGYSLIGLSAWAMMNNSVHWLSDYPLALALGYVSGKITCWRHHPKKKAVKPLF